MIFEYRRAGFEKSFPGLEGDVNVFTSSVNGADLTPITKGLKGSNHIEAISKDGRMLLVSSRSGYPAKGELLLIDLNSPGSDPLKIADGVPVSRWPQAIFLDNSRIAYVGRGQGEYGRLYTVNIDGTAPQKLGALQAEFAGLVSSDASHIYYKGWTKRSSVTLWWINIDGSGQGKLESNGQQIIPTELGEGAAFSPDGTKIAWIPGTLEQDCSELYLAFWTPDIRNGAYTEYVKRYAGSAFLPKDSPHVGKVIDTAYIEDHVRHCFMLHVASLSNLDNDTRIPLIPPFDPNKDDFYYHKDYVLRWWPDGSKILAYDGGFAMNRWGNTTGHYPLALYEMSLKDADPKLALLEVLSDSPVVAPGPGAMPRLVDSFASFNFSPDGRQLLFTKYEYDNQGSMIGILNLDTLNSMDEFSHSITPDFQIERAGDVYWLP